MSFIQQHGPYVLGFLAGLSAGAGLCIFYFRLQEDVRELRTVIVNLKHELEELRDEQERKGRRRKSSSYSIAVPNNTFSFSSEDEEFQDAISGTELEESEEDIFFNQIDDLMAGSKTDMEKAYHMLLDKRKSMSNSSEFMWRLSKGAYNVACIEGEQGRVNKKKELIFAGKDAALAALKLDNTCAEAHKWFAITLGSTGDYEGMSDKIKNAMLIKDHIEMSIKLNPHDATSQHMLGRWYYSVYMLTWLERKAASAIFSKPLVASINDALIHFMAAENINPGKWNENSLYIAKCYIEMKEYSKAVAWLKCASKGNVEDSGDADVRKEVNSLLAKYSH